MPSYNPDFLRPMPVTQLCFEVPRRSYDDALNGALLAQSKGVASPWIELKSGADQVVFRGEATFPKVDKPPEGDNPGIYTDETHLPLMTGIFRIVSVDFGAGGGMAETYSNVLVTAEKIPRTWRRPLGKSVVRMTVSTLPFLEPPHGR